MTLQRKIKLAFAEVRRQYPSIADEEIPQAIEDVLADWAQEESRDREMFGDPEDTPCIESGRDNCNDWGTGEGQYHGRM